MDRIQTLSELLETNIVEIPIVQRDYAQGRKDEHATLVRSNLLSDMKKAILGVTSTLDLNFVYGKEVNGKFIPLDGQQRLTTLFLLHLFAFRNEETFSEILQKFTYETRKSSRDFFEALIRNRKEALSSDGKVSSIIIDSEWFITEWENDPTVQSALVVLDEIVKVFSDVDNLSERLTQKENKPLVFQFLKMDDLSMEDSLYIKLNARGKPLTDFENFKARLFARLSDIDKGNSNNFELLFDGEWTDFFWEKFKNNFDERFLNFFQVLFVNNNIISDSNNWANRFEFEKLDKDIFTIICNILNAVVKKDYPELGGLIVEGTKTNSTYQEKLLFHAVTQYVKVSKGMIDESFNSWIRVASNLILNSQIDSPNTNAAAINGLNELSVHSSNVIKYLAESGKINGFAREQVKEELNKAEIIYRNPEFANSIYSAEKNNYFTGTIRPALNFSYKEGIFNEECFNNYWNKVLSLFNDHGLRFENLVRQALLTYSDYTIKVSEYQTLCVNDARESGSTPSIKRLFSDHPDKVQGLLDDLNAEGNTEEQLKKIISNSNVTQDDWRYCFIKYPQIFDKMNKAHLRIRDLGKRIITVSNKSSSGYNNDLYLTALALNLKERGIHSHQEPEGQGTGANIYLEVTKNFKVIFDKNKFVILDANNNRHEFSGVDIIDDASDYLISNLTMKKD